MRDARDERREFQRLRVDPPVAATIDSDGVLVVEIGVLGARIQHSRPLAPSVAELRFVTANGQVSLRCELVRTTGSEPRLETALRFVAAVGDSGDRLREFLADLVARELDVRRNLPRTAVRAGAVVDGDKTVRGKDAMFLCYRFENGHWKKTRAFLPEQPAIGFTVARWVDPSDVTRLCQVYEAADGEGRRLIQLFAELSVSDELDIPPTSPHH